MVLPTGFIVAYHPDGSNNIPNGWAVCNGHNGTPDLRDRFILGTEDMNEVGDTGGQSEIILGIEHLPSHAHEYWDRMLDQMNTYKNEGGNQAAHGTVWEYTRQTASTGESEPLSLMPRYCELIYIIKL